MEKGRIRIQEDEITQEDYESWKSSVMTKKLLNELKEKKQSLLEQFDIMSTIEMYSENKGASRMITEVIRYIEITMSEEVA